MGCILPRATSKKIDGVRVVHINGYVEDYQGPVTAGQVMGKSDRYLLCSSSNIFYSGKHACKPGDLLEPGRIYFMLPVTIWQSEASPVDVAALMNRLTALAKKGGSRAKGPSLIDSIMSSHAVNESPIRASDGDMLPMSVKSQADVSPNHEFVTASGKWGSRSAWKPHLDRIDESFRKSMRMDSMRNYASVEVEIDNGNEFRNKTGNKNIGVVL